MNSPTNQDQEIHKAGLVAGLGLLFLAVLAGYATLGIVGSLVTEGDASKTAHDILASQSLFRLAIASLAVAAILDIVVAWALQVFFKPVNKHISTLAAIFRTVYAGIYLVAISQLLSAVSLLSSTPYSKAFSTNQIHAEALSKVDAFNYIWQVGLILFGIHLLLLGYLAYKSVYVPKLIGVLLVVAGFGYVIDSFGTILLPGYAADVGRFTFVGEAVLFIWLLIKGRKVTTARHGA